jgi:hypothetical protein
MCCDGTQQHHNNRSTGQENGSLAIPSKLFPSCIVVECLLPVLQVLPGLVGCCPYSLLSHCFVVFVVVCVVAFIVAHPAQVLGPLAHVDSFVVSQHPFQSKLSNSSVWPVDSLVPKPSLFQSKSPSWVGGPVIQCNPVAQQPTRCFISCPGIGSLESHEPLVSQQHFPFQAHLLKPTAVESNQSHWLHPTSSNPTFHNMLHPLQVSGIQAIL